jgi:fumarylacetoacetate (FAA) hydrolase
MKLASLNDGSRDGQLVVVSRDLCTAHYATGIADHLQQALDDWNFMSPQLQDLYDTLNFGKPRHAFPLDPRLCLAPLPRAHLLAMGNAYADPPGNGDASRLLTLGFSDELVGPCAALRAGDATDRLDFEASWALITGDVPESVAPQQALEAVRLLMLVSHTRLRADGSAAGAGLPGWATTPQSAFSPVAVTPDELLFGGDSAWRGGRLQLTLQCSVNGRKLGLLDAGGDLQQHAGELIAALAARRRLRAGAVVCMGEVRQNGRSAGQASVAARRALELAQDGQAKTPWLAAGDSVNVEMKGRDGLSVFGAITQSVTFGPTR